MVDSKELSEVLEEEDERELSIFPEPSTAKRRQVFPTTESSFLEGPVETAKRITLGAKAAAFRYSPTVSGLVLGAGLAGNVASPNKPFLVDSLNGTKYEKYKDYFANNAQTEGDAGQLKLQIDYQEWVESSLGSLGFFERAGAEILGFGAAFLFDPINKFTLGLNPFASGFKRVMTEIAILEATPTATRLKFDPDYTKREALEDSAKTMAFAAGIYGVGVGAGKVYNYAKGKYMDYKKPFADLANKNASKISREIYAENPTKGLFSDMSPTDAGSLDELVKGISEPLTPTEEILQNITTYNTNVVGGTKKISWIAGVSPQSRTVYSPLETVRGLSRRLIRSPERVVGDVTGEFVPDVPALTLFSRTKDTNIKQLHTIVNQNLEGSGLSKEQFSAALTQAMHNGDQHIIPEVQKAAQELRRKVLQPLTNELVGRKLLTEGELKNAKSWSHMVWSDYALTQDRAGFLKLLEDGFKRRYDGAKAALEYAETQFKLNNTEQTKKALDAAREALKEAKYKPGISARSVYFNITTDSNIAASYGTRGGYKKERVLDFIDVNDAMPYLNTDWISVHENWIDNVSRELALYDALGGSYTSVTDSPFKTAIQEEIFSLGLEPLQEQKLFEESMLDLDSLFQIVRGTYNNTGSAAPMNRTRHYSRMLRGLVNLTKLGTAGLSAVMDVTLAIKEVGITNWLRDGLSSIARNLPKGGKSAFVEDFAGVLNNQQSRFLDEGMRTGELFNIRPKGVLERAVDASQNVLNNINGVKLIDETITNMNMELTYQYIMRLLQKPKLTPKEIAFLSRHNINTSRAEMLRNTLKTKGVWKEGGMFMTDFSAKEAEIMSDAMRLGGQFLSLNPKSYELPISYKNEMTKWIGMYKSYLFAVQQKVLISSLRERDLRHLFMLGASVGVGMMKYRASEIISGKDEKYYSENLVYEGVKESGAFGLFGIPIDVAAGIYDEGRVDDPVLSIPAIQVARDITKVTNFYLSGRKYPTKQERLAKKRLTPCNNTFGVGYAWNKAIANDY